MNSEAYTPNILVVDDEPKNIQVLGKILTRENYQISFAQDGQQALDIISNNLPDIILLDIMMPGLDGFEVCKILKSDKKTQQIPVIFITAQTEMENEIEGLRIGAVDYITKPIKPEIVLSRVNTHLSLVAAYRKLEQQNTELIEAAKLREDVEQITRHDLKGPLNGIINFPQLIIEEENLNDEQVEMLQMIEESGYRMLNMLNLTLDLFKMERGMYVLDPAPVNILHVILKIFRESQGLLTKGHKSINVTYNEKTAGPLDKCFVQGEELLFYSMFSNLIKNALEATIKGEMVTISINQASEISINIYNKQPVPEEIRHTFFEKYSTSGKIGGTGLGAYSAKLIAETLKGKISMHSSEESGTTVSLLFPL